MNATPSALTPLRLAAAGAALALLAACSSTPAPTAEMAVSRTAVQQAGASPDVASKAPVELERARTKLTEAERALAAKDYDAARRLASEAEADARLAQAKTQAARNADSLSQVQQGVRALQEELSRHQPAQR